MLSLFATTLIITGAQIFDLIYHNHDTIHISKISVLFET